MTTGLLMRYNPYICPDRKCLRKGNPGLTPSIKPDMSLSPLSSNGSCGSLSPSSMGGHVLSLDYSRGSFMDVGQAQLVMLVAPETHFRYRYDTEMSGAHGSLQADRGTRDKQIPTVQLVGVTGPAVIRVSLATCNQGLRYPHPHHLFVREKLYQRRYTNLNNKEVFKTGHYIDPHYIVVSESDYTASFEGMCIISAKKEQFTRVIRQKLQERGHHDPLILDQKVQEALSHVDMAFVSLCFEAFRFDDGIIGEAICAPLYSEPIANAKNASSGKLKITRINIVSGSCQGGDSVWLLVEKINKRGLIVRFFEQAADGSVLWESIVESDKLELHYQHAVIFDTPPYRDPNISQSVTVSMRLERRVVPYDCSEAETFTYEPCKSRYIRNDIIHKRDTMSTTNKRPMADLFPSYMLPSKRKPDDFISTDPFYNAHSDPEFQAILMELFQLDSVDLDKASECKQEILYKFVKMLLNRSRDSDIKNVTEKIGRLFLRPDDLRLQDAASTLLSLRTGGMGHETIHAAIASGDVDAALKAGCSAGDLNDDGQTALHVAVEKGNSSLVELLLAQKNVSQWINVRDKLGRTAVHLAIKLNLFSVLERLLEAGADAHLANSVNGETTMDLGVKSTDERIVKKILGIFKTDCKTECTESLPDETISPNLTVLEKLSDILNLSGKWENLASLMDASEVIPEANLEKNPSLFFLKHIQKSRGMDLSALRHLLDALDEKDAIAVVDETLAKQFM